MSFHWKLPTLKLQARLALGFMVAAIVISAILTGTLFFYFQSKMRKSFEERMLGMVAVAGQAPLAELANYQARLNGLTGGQGRYTLALSHYEAVPPTVQAQLAAAFKPRDED